MFVSQVDDARRKKGKGRGGERQMMKRKEEMQEQPTSHSLQNRVLCEVDNRGEGRKGWKDGRNGNKRGKVGRGRRTCLALMAGAVKVQVVSGVCPCCARLRECVWWMGINEKWKAAMEALPSLPGDHLT
jgi:hypothetical protein